MMFSGIDKRGLREFLQGKLSVEDNLSQDFIHGFASAYTLMAIDRGMSCWEAGNETVCVSNLVEEVLHSLRGGSVN